ncbi:MAG: hypothetical protein ACREH9_01395, partial [Pseudomonadota bacterium]
GPRYASMLAAYVPPDAVIYAAIPNLGDTLAQASQMFDERARQSEALREWWTQERGAQLRQAMEKVRTFSQYLGDEIVLTVSPDASGRLRGAPVILAEMKRPGLSDLLATEFKSGPELYTKDNILAISPEALSLHKAEASIARPGAFPRTPFYRRIAQAYEEGAGWLFAADMEQIVKKSVPPNGLAAVVQNGMNDVRYLVVERREKDGQTQNRAALSFAGQRHGVAAWLAAPAPMGSLDFVSPGATLAASFAVKNPVSILQEVLAANTAFARNLSEFESATGVDVVNDLTGSLGGDFTFAFDGALLPAPSWKLAIEVYDPARLEASIERLVSAWNQKQPAQQENLMLANNQSGSNTFYTLHGGRLPMEIDYTFNDGYFLAAPSRALLDTAIQNRAAGMTLARSTTFQSLLPTDGYTNFSGLVYHNLGTTLQPLAEQLKATGVLKPADQTSLDALSANVAPGLIYAYGEPDRIVVASVGSLFDLGLNALAGGGSSALLHRLLKGALPGRSLSKQ